MSSEKSTPPSEGNKNENSYDAIATIETYGKGSIIS
jgi:hypothetical protein